jgi:hypothetical protein
MREFDQGKAGTAPDIETADTAADFQVIEALQNEVSS